LSHIRVSYLGQRSANLLKTGDSYVAAALPQIGSHLVNARKPDFVYLKVRIHQYEYGGVKHKGRKSANSSHRIYKFVLLGGATFYLITRASRA